VGDDHAGHPAVGGRAQQAHHAFPVDGVERAGGLVGEQQGALADDRPGDRDPLALAAGELVRVAVRALGDVELLERLERRRARRLRADSVELERQGGVLGRRQPGEQVEVLEDVADRPPPHRRPVRARDAREVDALDEHLAAGRVLEAAGDRQERALAEPLGPMIATSSPRRTHRSTSLRACTSFGPEP
jgi:hypothetical protein